VLLGGVDDASGRAPIQLVAPKDLEGQKLKVKPANLRVVT